MATESVSYRRIVAIALPVIAANILLPLQGLVDTAIMGHFQKAVYLSALGLGAAAFSLLYVSVNFLQYATSGLSAQALGAQDYARLQRILWRALLIAASLGCIFWLARHLIIALAQTYFAADGQIADLMGEYMRWRIIGAPLELGIYCTIGWFAGQSQTRAILIQQAVLTGSNIVLSLLLVYGFDMAIRGVALGTVIANLLALSYGLWAVNTRQHSFQLNFLRPDWSRILRWQEIRAVLSLNRDLLIRSTMLVLCISWFSRMGNTLGENILAANVVLFWFLYIAAYALDGIAVAAEGLTGQSIGEGNASRLSLIIRRCTIASLVTALAITLIYSAGFPLFLAVMTDIETVAEIAYRYRWWAIILPIAGVGGYLLDGFYFAATAAAPLRNTMIIIAIITLPLSAWLTHTYGNGGLWLSIYVFLLLRPILLAPKLPSTLRRALQG
ncbi:MATE family efflux transporter [Suttonella sp. R2A3]|uniref:MATE family efflux transporter n=1 Tax=Suttonella sp. R2A3 TaxID=2908648 RepID=UPI001F403088|nr:MATE family efflux transporter [Suttonella sp. R2A3]UJF24134.1 MATE family efflux transporter [Suttonella sp. R2A3]